MPDRQLTEKTDKSATNSDDEFLFQEENQEVVRQASYFNFNNIFDSEHFMKTMDGKNSDTNGTSPARRRRRSSGDSDLVVLSVVLNKKQKENDEVAMAIERLRQNGVNCVFFTMNDIRNGNRKPDTEVSEAFKMNPQLVQTEHSGAPNPTSTSTETTCEASISTSLPLPTSTKATTTASSRTLLTAQTQPPWFVETPLPQLKRQPSQPSPDITAIPILSKSAPTEVSKTSVPTRTSADSTVNFRSKSKSLSIEVRTSTSSPPSPDITACIVSKSNRMPDDVKTSGLDLTSSDLVVIPVPVLTPILESSIPVLSMKTESCKQLKDTGRISPSPNRSRSPSPPRLSPQVVTENNNTLHEVKDILGSILSIPETAEACALVELKPKRKRRKKRRHPYVYRQTPRKKKTTEPSLPNTRATMGRPKKLRKIQITDDVTSTTELLYQNPDVKISVNCKAAVESDLNSCSSRKIVNGRRVKSVKVKLNGKMNEEDVLEKIEVKFGDKGAASRRSFSPDITARFLSKSSSRSQVSAANCVQPISRKKVVQRESVVSKDVKTPQTLIKVESPSTQGLVIDSTSEHVTEAARTSDSSAIEGEPFDSTKNAQQAEVKLEVVELDNQTPTEPVLHSYKCSEDSLPDSPDAMQLRRSSFYSLVSGNVRTNMENYLDGRIFTQKSPKRRKRVKNGFLLHHGDNYPEDPESPYKLHLATQVLLKLNKRRSKFKPKEDRGKSLLSYLKLAPKRSTRMGKSPAKPQEELKVAEEDALPLFSGEWTLQRKFVCGICAHVEDCFWDMVNHKGEYHPGVLVTHVELTHAPPAGLIRSPSETLPATSCDPPPPCSKCSQTFSSFADLHRHIFECAGNAAWLEEKTPRKRRGKRRRGFKRRLSNTPKKPNTKKVDAAKRRHSEVFKCEFCTREFKTEGWLKNHLVTHSLPISIPLEKLSLPSRASFNSRSCK